MTSFTAVVAVAVVAAAVRSAAAEVPADVFEERWQW
jgi:hypothetical protein